MWFIETTPPIKSKERVCKTQTVLVNVKKHFVMFESTCGIKFNTIVYGYAYQPTPESKTIIDDRSTSCLGPLGRVVLYDDPKNPKKSILAEWCSATLLDTADHWIEYKEYYYESETDC